MANMIFQLFIKSNDKIYVLVYQRVCPIGLEKIVCKVVTKIVNRCNKQT